MSKARLHKFVGSTDQPSFLATLHKLGTTNKFNMNKDSGITWNPTLASPNYDEKSLFQTAVTFFTVIGR